MKYTVEKVFSRPFQRYIKTPKILKTLIGKPKTTNLWLFIDCISRWSTAQWKNDYGSFLQCFLLVMFQILFLSLVIASRSSLNDSMFMAKHVLEMTTSQLFVA
jgi:hypothetical protein